MHFPRVVSHRCAIVYPWRLCNCLIHWSPLSFSRHLLKGLSWKYQQLVWTRVGWRNRVLHGTASDKPPSRNHLQLSTGVTKVLVPPPPVACRLQTTECNWNSYSHVYTRQDRIAQLHDYHDSLRTYKAKSDSTTSRLSQFIAKPILNGKHSTLEPLRANQLSFIHDIGADGEYEWCN